MKIKDYLHLYLGCEVQCYEPELCINEKGLLWQINSFGSCRIGGKEQMFPIPIVKPILRSTQSMTQDEWNNAPKKSLSITPDGCFFSPELFSYMLSLHIDLFGLIEAGLAIDKTTVK